MPAKGIEYTDTEAVASSARQRVSPAGRFHHVKEEKRGQSSATQDLLKFAAADHAYIREQG